MQQNRTIKNISRSRRKKRTRRHIPFFRWLIFIITLLTAISFASYITYRIFEGASYLYDEYLMVKDNYKERKINQGVNVQEIKGYTNILVMGIDDGISIDGAEGIHADTIFLASMDHENGKLRIMAIPPDTYISGSEGEGRISNFYANGGAPRMVRAMSEFLRVSVHQYMVIDSNAFQELINALGGISVYVEDDMDYDDAEGNISIHLKKGFQRLDGKQAEDFLRYRNTALGDMGRTHRQQKFIKALYQKLLQLDTVSKLPRIAEIFQNNVDTSAEIFDSAHIANIIRKLSSDPPTIITLPGDFQEANRIWIPNLDETELKMQEFFPNISEAER